MVIETACKFCITIIVILLSRFYSNTSFGTAEGSANASLDLSQLSSDVAEKFAAEMNDWYKNKEHQIETAPTPKGHSTATLV